MSQTPSEHQETRRSARHRERAEAEAARLREQATQQIQDPAPSANESGSHSVAEPIKEISGKGRTALVTGASGMLGAEVARTLLRKGWKVRVMQRRHSHVAELEGVDEVLASVTDPERVAEALHGVDDVIHLAAKVSFTGEWDEFVKANVTGTRVLLTQAQDAGVHNVVFVSSPSVAHTGESIHGAGADPANPQEARGNYARSKAYAELLALKTDGRRDLRVTAVRPHIVWGPGDTQLVERVVERADAGRMPHLDQGAALIDTTYIDNAAEAIVRALERIEVTHGKALVVTNGEPRPVGELVSNMCHAAGVDAPSRSVPGSVARVAGKVIETVWPYLPAKLRGDDPEPPMTEFLAEQMSTAHWFDQTETQRLLDWKPAVSLDEGFERLAQYYAQKDDSQETTGSTSIDRVLDVADDQRVRAEHSSSEIDDDHPGTEGNLRTVSSK